MFKYFCKDSNKWEKYKKKDVFYYILHRQIVGY